MRQGSFDNKWLRRLLQIYSPLPELFSLKGKKKPVVSSQFGTKSLCFVFRVLRAIRCFLSKGKLNHNVVNHSSTLAKKNSFLVIIGK